MADSPTLQRKKEAVKHDLGHTFVKKSYKRPTYCHHCNELLWGLVSQGLQCDACNFVTHEKCCSKIVATCITTGSDSTEEPFVHDWMEIKIKKKVFCNWCRLVITSDSGFFCESCGYWSHGDCVCKALNNCRPTATYINSDEFRARKKEYTHFWREGNLSSKAVCIVCTKSMGSKSCLFGFRCGWCHCAVHPGCMALVPLECSFGDNSAGILRPHCISLGPHIDFSDNVVVDVEKEQLLDLNSLVLGEYSELFVHEGVPFMNGAYHKIIVQSNMSIPLVVSLALKAFGIYDNPEFYYLAQVLIPNEVPPSARRAVISASRSTESILSPSVLEGWRCECGFFNNPRSYLCDVCGEHEPSVSSAPPLSTQDASSSRAVVEKMVPPDARVSFLLEASAPKGFMTRFYLRSHHAVQVDEGKAIIRVFIGEEFGRGTSSFKTIPLTKDSTVAEVIGFAKSKFGIELDVSDLCIQEVRLNRRIKKRLLKPTENVFSRRLQFQKVCINMNLQRFYLRKASHIADRPTSLFVSGLPRSLTESQIKQTLKELLQAESIKWSLPLIIPNYGSFIMSFKSPEDAEHIALVLRLSTFEGAPLTISWQPEIQVDQIPESTSPLLVFVNSKSGGGQGKEILAKIRVLLNPHQVFDLTHHGPMQGIYAFRTLPQYRVLVCGGDGTAGWVLNCMDDFRDHALCPSPAVAVLPVGTGNDLSRVLRWGGGYTGEKISPIITQALQAEPINCDRWLVEFPSTPQRASPFTMTNYFGIGIDAQIALDFHELREECPEKFTSRTRNKGHYVMMGMDALMKRTCKDLNGDVLLICDGKELSLSSQFQGLILLNIPSWGGGADPWGTDKDEKFRPPAMDDGYLELVGVHGVLHLSHISTHLRTGKRLGQFREVIIRTSTELPIQVDGEPWRQPPGVIVISWKEHQVVFLKRLKDKELKKKKLERQQSRSETELDALQP